MAGETDSRSLWLDYRRTREKAIRDRLIVNYSPLVKYVAGRLGSGLPAHVEEADLISYGLVGLISAIERFELEREIKEGDLVLTLGAGDIYRFAEQLAAEGAA